MQDDVFFESVSDDLFVTSGACIEIAPYGSFPVDGERLCEATVAATMATMAEALCYRIGKFLPARRF